MAKGRRRYPIIDSHIHLYPRSENDSIGWIDPDHHLAGQWSVDQYRHATKTASSSLYGFVVVEVNRTHDDDLETGKTDGSGWRGPLQEVAYMSRIALGEPRDGEGHSAEDSKRCLGLVPWAPITSGPAVLERYLGSVRKVAGAAWPRVRGFRYLLQDSPCGLFQRGEFVDSVKMLGRRGFVFEICADYHGRGQGQLDDAVALAELAHEGVRESDQVTLVINHFLKPDLTAAAEPSGASYQAWAAAIEALGRSKNTYIKISGAFSETSAEIRALAQDGSCSAVAEFMQPWFTTILKAFGPQRMMFGSDWPVCTVGMESAWACWREVVEAMCLSAELEEGDVERVFSGTAREVYRL